MCVFVRDGEKKASARDRFRLDRDLVHILPPVCPALFNVCPLHHVRPSIHSQRMGPCIRLLVCRKQTKMTPSLSSVRRVDRHNL